MPVHALFHRTELAVRMADQILGTPAASAMASGLFLSAPRRTGKSTFIREDLRPALSRRGALVLYTDLWEDRRLDPGQVMVSSVRQALSQNEKAVIRLAKAIGLKGVKVGGVGVDVDLSKLGLGKDVSLTAALVALSDETRKSIVFIIDEAQHAITTEGGTEALFSLKAARDELNSSRHHGLRVVATGSNQDKLAMLRNSKDQPFFGAPLVQFPPLGEDYVTWFCEHANLPAPLDPKRVDKLFKRAAFRPEILGAAADAVRFDFAVQPKGVARRFETAVEEQIRASNHELMRLVHALTPLQSAVLRVIALRGTDYAPFEAATFDLYRAALKAAGMAKAIDPDVANVQQALAALQDKQLVWRAARGVYALEEAQTADVLRAEGMLRFAS